MRRALLLLAVVLSASAPAGAQPFAMPWHTVDAGGATFSTGGGYTLGGTMGQPDASRPMVSATFALTGGFWNQGIASQPPVLAAIGDRTVAEGTPLTFTVSASDPEGDPLTFSAASLPPGATFDPAK